MSEAHRDSPYQGLVPYAEEDAEYFFGREEECELIIANLCASRLTVLYGASGVGKSSLLRAGVAHRLRETARAEVAGCGTSEFLVVVFSSWRGSDPVAGLVRRVRESAELVWGAERLPEVAPRSTLADTLEAWAEALDTQLLVILDQFEEYMLYHRCDDGPGSFADEFPRAVNRARLRANFMISLREDALASLERFKGRIPGLFDTNLRIDHLPREAGRRAFEGPLERYNRGRPEAEHMRAEPVLVDAVLDEVRRGRVRVDDAGAGRVAREGAAEDHVETPYLQLVAIQLWRAERAAGGGVLRLETLRRLGGADRIVQTHLDAVLADFDADETDAAACIFHYLVTPGGSKIAHTAADLAAMTELPIDRIECVLRRLAADDRRILRFVDPSYEIYHDVLAGAILAWRRRFTDAQREAEIRRSEQAMRAQERRRMRVRAATLGGMLVCALLGALAYASYQRTQARQEAQRADESTLAATEAAQEMRLRNLARATAAAIGAAPEPPATAGLIEQLAAPPGDRARRSAVRVRYYQPVVLQTGLIDSLDVLGYQVEPRQGRFQAPPNSIAFGSGVALEDVKLLALMCLHYGIPIKRIRPFREQRDRAHVIEVVHAPALEPWAPLSAEEVDGLTPEILRRARN